MQRFEAWLLDAYIFKIAKACTYTYDIVRSQKSLVTQTETDNDRNKARARVLSYLLYLKKQSFLACLKFSLFKYVSKYFL